ncbi:SDR family NAD(P)-dependent oxidoreductase [Paraburkholderia sp. HP33-1]|uniref:SDR family NAD(P)-dependent oxidoreductase n=1 Tax=Paraburkholderia sp. HP33-1 TaxID=2883243 RepID=UPI001F33800E|nr:SDR family NAD(P)-dependent oxidoreductase [Paraburkholderia sp. HP33-1]
MSTKPSGTTLITGAASGMGAALARHLTALGERVIGVDLRDAEVCVDLSIPAQRTAFAARVRHLTPSIDAVVACAGVSPPVSGDTLVAVNYFGVTDLLPRLLPILHRGKEPRVVVISSLASLHPVDTRLVELCLEGNESAAREQAGKIGAQSYASSKRALTQWIRRTAALPGGPRRACYSMAWRRAS